MPGRSDFTNTFISLLVVLVFVGCASPPAATATVPPPSAANPLPQAESSSTPAPAPTTLATTAVTPTPTATKAISQWLLSGSYVQAGLDDACAAALAPGAVLLGANPSACQPAETAGVAEILVQPPPADTGQIALLRLSCADTAGGCTHAVTVTEPGGVITITVDDQVLWQADCLTLSLEECTTRFVAEEPIFAFAASETAVHHIQIKTSPHISWLLSDIQIEWQPVPEVIRGVAFSPFRDCQNPHWGPFPSVAQVQEDLLLMRHMGNAVRTYSSMDVQGQIPALAHDLGLRVVAGAWLGPDKEKNEAEIEALIELVRQDVGIESVIVGNEVLLRGDLTEAELIAYIERVKTAVDVPVTTAETIGHLYSHPELIAAVDYVLVHIYAFWDGVAIENAAQHTLNMFHLTQDIAQGKPVVIGETGWPSKGPTNGTAIASIENEQRFWHEFLTLAQQENIEFFSFAVFDELWKTEGGVGPYWGMLDSERRNKFDLQSIYVPLNYASQPAAEMMPMPTATRGATIVSAQEQLFPIFVNYAAAENHFAPSGYMGDYHAISYTDCARLTDVWEETAVLIHYDPALENEQGWAAI